MMYSYIGHLWHANRLLLPPHYPAIFMNQAHWTSPSNAYGMHVPLKASINLTLFLMKQLDHVSFEYLLGSTVRIVDGGARTHSLTPYN